MKKILRATARAFLVLLVAASLAGARPAQERPDLRELESRYASYVAELGAFVCGTDPANFPDRYRLQRLPGGTPIFFSQDPPILTMDYRGKVTLRELMVVGDVPKLTFEPSIFDTNAPVKNETWKRVATRNVDGVTVSVFEPSWNAGEVDRMIAGKYMGFDLPYMTWGRIASQVNGRNAAVERFRVFLRVAPTKLQQVTVRTINDSVAYSSDVINVVVPGFGNGRITRTGYDIESDEVTTMMYEYFKDVYHSVAIVPRESHLSNEYSAFHRLVQNRVAGIGLNLFDRNGEYNSGGTLQGVEWYPHISFGSQATTLHEFSHQWASFFDWQSIADIAGAGHDSSAHTPLITGGETLVGAVLEGDREVVGSGRRPARGAFSIGLPAVPYTYHPLTLYAMGIISKGQLPAMAIFANQAQFGGSSSVSPDIGTPVTGGTVAVDGNALAAFHGERNGPRVPAAWKRATVVVSRDELMSQEEFDYWTWISQRKTYNKRNNGIVSWDGYGSMRQASGKKIRLVTAAEPLNGAPIKQKLKIGYETISPEAWRGFRLNAPFPTKIKAGSSITVAGRVTATDRNDFTSVGIRFTPYDPEGTARLGAFGPEDAGRSPSSRGPDFTFAAIGADDTFSATITFDKADKGRYWLDLFLFWPNSGSQYARTGRTPIHVE